MNSLTPNTNPFALMLEGLSHYYPLAKFCGDKGSSGLNKLFRIQTGGVPGEIEQIVEAQSRHNFDNQQIQKVVNADLPGIAVLNQNNYATFVVNQCIFSWCLLMGEWIKMGCDLERFKVEPKGSEQEKYWASLFKGIIKYRSYPPNQAVCEKMREFVYLFKDNWYKRTSEQPGGLATIITAVDNLDATLRSQMMYLKSMGGRITKPDPMPYGALLHFVERIYDYVEYFFHYREYLLKLFNVLHSLCRLLFGVVGDFEDQTLLCLNKEDEYTRISDVTVAAIPAPNPNSIHYFREGESPYISRHALLYVDRVCAAYKGIYTPR